MLTWHHSIWLLLCRWLSCVCQRRGPLLLTLLRLCSCIDSLQRLRLLQTLLLGWLLLHRCCR